MISLNVPEVRTIGLRCGAGLNGYTCGRMAPCLCAVDDMPDLFNHLRQESYFSSLIASFGVTKVL